MIKEFRQILHGLIEYRSNQMRKMQDKEQILSKLDDIQTLHKIVIFIEDLGASYQVAYKKLQKEKQKTKELTIENRTLKHERQQLLTRIKELM